jgi:hypothetical protein
MSNQSYQPFWTNAPPWPSWQWVVSPRNIASRTTHFAQPSDANWDYLSSATRRNTNANVVPF